MDYINQMFDLVMGYEHHPKNIQARHILAFGNVLVDHTLHLADRKLLDRHQLDFNSKGEIEPDALRELVDEVCANKKNVCGPGGSALNTVRLLHQLGADATFFGAVGADEFGDFIKELMKIEQIDTRLETIKDQPTGQCVCLVLGDSNALYANIGASAHFSASFLSSHTKEGSSSVLRPIHRKQILYIEGFFIPHRKSVCQFIVDNYIKERRRLALNLSAPYIVRETAEFMEMLARTAYFIFGNQDEYEALMDVMNCSSHEEMAKELLQDGEVVKIIIITKGANGVLVISNYDGELCVPGKVTFQTYNAPKVPNVVDTTGAGDAFVAGFLKAWLQKRGLSECVRKAIDVAACVCTQIGTNLPKGGGGLAY